MRRILIILATLLVSTAMFAGTLIVSGDSNIGNGIDGSFGAPMPADNGLFFTNILGTGTKVVQQNGYSSGSTGLAENAIFNLYNSLAGVSITAVSSSFTATDLAGANLFISILPETGYTTSQLAAMGSFLGGGGTLFLIGENADTEFTAINGYLNTALTTLGSGMAINPAMLDCGSLRAATGGQIANQPLNAGVSSFDYSCASGVTGGTALYYASDGTSFVAFQSIPEPASLFLYGSGLLILASAIRRRMRR
ncbi:MAG TPA: hypothetical protein VN577_07155 [Terriglobales bacterium]|nr:hypothetical protein [Terriglobales bacterium]